MVEAYVDESLRQTGGGRYVLAAALVRPERADPVRAALRGALPRGLRRYHWHYESAASRRAMCALLGGLGVEALAVTTTPVAPRGQERARRQCLQRLLYELDACRVRDAVLESRGHGDASDVRMIAFARRAGWVSGDLVCRFGAPLAEPLLWAADVVAGAAATALHDGDDTYARLLGRVTTIDV